jgi:mono/diheme cytochrome c family protein
MRTLLHSVFWISLGVLAGMVVAAGWSTPTHAYPEYTARTGEQCTTCHVNPAGGGPRTLRGLLWLADGKQDTVPPLPGSSAAASDQVLDGAGLYEKLECGRCHGLTGEGGVGPALNDAEQESAALTNVIVNGVGTMKGYGVDALSTAEMEVLVAYLRAMGRGEIKSAIILQKRLLPPAQLSCTAGPAATPAATTCGGN